MKKLILIYLYSILLIPILLRISLGKLENYVIHPGLFIHGLVLSLLILYYTRFVIQKGIPKTKISNIIIGFSIVYLINFTFIELTQFSGTSIYQSLEYTFKIFLFLFLAFYVYQNIKYFSTKADSILLVNSIVIVANVIMSHHLGFGWHHYERALGENYRGFLAANDTSVFTFVAFGYSLFNIGKRKILQQSVTNILLLLASIYSLYIISSKAIFVAGIILLFYLFSQLKVRKTSKILIPLAIIGGLYIYFSFYQPEVFQERLFRNYLSSISQTEDQVYSIQFYPDFVLWLNKISPGRALTGVMMISYQFTDNLMNTIFGYGVGGIYAAFGRPPMAHLFSVIGHYGLLGFIVFYVPQLLLAITIIKNLSYNVINVLFLSMFLYGSLGGFVYGVSNTSILFALLFGLSLYQTRNPIRQYAIK